MKIARVFCRRTSATPDDSLVFVNEPPSLFLPEIDEVHICVVFTWDMAEAERLYRQWEVLGVPVKTGGPAFDRPGGGFIPGLYVKKGITVTSRGCPNRCWFCRVPYREPGGIRELEIKDGFNIFDDNLLACSDEHIRNVFAMLGRQKERPLFTGGLEAELLKPRHCELLRRSAAERIYFAYDSPEDLEPLVDAGKMLRQSGIPERNAYCYVLCGYPGDTFEQAEKRMKQTVKAGFMPYAMLYRDAAGQYRRDWAGFRRGWLRPAIVRAKMKEMKSND